MNNNEYEKLVKSIVKKESSIKNILIAFFTGGLMGLLGQVLSSLYIKLCSVSVNTSYLYVSLTFVIIGSILTGIGVFDKVLSFCKCGLIVPTTGFANSMTSAAMDYRKEGFVKGIGSNIFKLSGSIILYGVVFGVIFGLIRGLIL